MKKIITTLFPGLLGSRFPPDGSYEKFHDNGQLWRRGNFIDGERDGLKESFDRNGNLTKTETWENGELVETLPAGYQEFLDAAEELRNSRPELFQEE